MCDKNVIVKMKGRFKKKTAGVSCCSPIKNMSSSVFVDVNAINGFRSHKRLTAVSHNILFIVPNFRARLEVILKSTTNFMDRMTDRQALKETRFL